MAGITTQTTLKAEYLIYQAELDRLVDAPEFTADGLTALHTTAWTAVQRDLARKRPGLLLADLSDTSELQHACHLWVLQRLYDASALDDDKVAAKRWRREYDSELSDVKITTSGGVTAAEAEDTMLVRG